MNLVLWIRNFQKSFFLPSTTDWIEDINRYMNSLNLILTDIDPSESGENFDPSKLDFENEDRQRTRESVLRVLRKAIDLFNSNLQKNADGLLATKPHRNEDILWIGEKGKHVPENLFALSY